VVTQYIPHPITEDFRTASFLPTTCFVDTLENIGEGYVGRALAYTGPGSWAESDFHSISAGSVDFDNEVDIPGPVPVMATIEGAPPQDSSEKAAAPISRLVVIGDSNFIDNANIGMSANKDLFLNTIAWLSREENLISIRKKERDSIPMFLSGWQQVITFLIPVVVMPLIALGLGIMVMLRLRKE